MSGSPRSQMQRYRAVVRDLRYLSVPQWKCSALDRAHRESLAVSTLEALPGHKRVRIGATAAKQPNALRCALINVATPRTNRAALAIWSQRIAVPSTVTNERHVRFIHSRRFHQIKPGIVSELQARLWW